MKHSLLLLTLCLSPALALAHPGHFEGSPVAHDLSHGLFYLSGIAALYLTAKQHGPQIRRELTARIRRR